MRTLALMVLMVTVGAKRGTPNVERGTPGSDFRVPTSAFITIGRLHYDGGGDWYANPSSLPNLLAALRARTTLPVADRERVVTLTGPELWDVPYIYMTGHGNVHFSDGEIRNLRRYLEQGERSRASFRTIRWLRCR